MFDNMLRIGASFDWFTPLWTLVLSARRRPTVTYAVPVDFGGGPSGMGRMLRGWGVEVWGVDIYDDETIFHARQSQAQYIQIQLERNGIPYRGGLEFNPTTAGEKPGRENKGVDTPGHFRPVETALNWIDAIVD